MSVIVCYSKGVIALDEFDSVKAPAQIYKMYSVLQLSNLKTLLEICHVKMPKLIFEMLSECC